MSFSGMDVDEVENLAAQLELEAKAVAMVVSVVDRCVGGLLGVWEGDDVHLFNGQWTQSHRPKAGLAADELAGLVAQLRQQAHAQRGASDGEGISGHGAQLPGSHTPGNVSANDLLTFAIDAEKESDAFLANGLAGDDHLALPPGWSPATSAELLELGIDPSTLHDAATGFDSTIYSNGHGGYIVSYAGSTPDPLNPASVDWFGGGGDYAAAFDVELTVAESRQAEQAADLAYLITIQAGKDNVVFTGHSLGGREAALASVATGARAVTFNPTGTTTEDLVYANATRGRDQGLAEIIGDVFSGGTASHVIADSGSNITNYVMSNDIAISTHNSGSKDYLGIVHVILSTDPNPLTAHNASNFRGLVPRD